MRYPCFLLAWIRIWQYPKFFLKGTQLKQLSDEYEEILGNIQKTYKLIEGKRQVIPDLKNAVREAESRYKGAQRALEAKEKLEEINQELAWAYVKDKEKVYFASYYNSFLSSHFCRKWAKGCKKLPGRLEGFQSIKMHLLKPTWVFWNLRLAIYIYLGVRVLLTIVYRMNWERPLPKSLSSRMKERVLEM